MAINEERILDFLDGRLNSGQEEELLHTLAVSPERRGLLRAHMRLRELTSNLASAERLSVPKHVTSQLFRTLQTMGLSATASTDQILTNAPQLAKLALAEKTAETFGTSAIAVGTGWQLSFASIAAATLLSFTLGAGAYHVFARSLGLTSVPEVRTIVQLVPQPATPSPANLQSKATSPMHSDEAPLSLDHTTNIRASAPAAPTVSTLPGSFEGGPSIASASPLDRPILPEKSDQFTKLASQHLMARAIETPLESEKGTISFRYGTGVMPTNNISSMSSLSEVKFRWTLWNYVVGQASLGQLQSFVHEAKLNPDPRKQGEITTEEVANSTFVIGAEAGLTLDPLHLPFEATGGFLVDGAGTPYLRTGIFAHYEPFEALSIIAGIEGVWYTHSIQKSIDQKEMMYQDFSPHLKPGSAQGNETAGFFGPSLEFGWHF
ncbi:MAG: hypothetical protein Q8922_08550 [Bacteroidota bacterium]|nr:hypothetical protein [Bacteroidota bacterium]MDP4234354.1 hypothetical protein [Bacteroidota bacterium]MDP4243288.1 hypothetical protein [Bacteroidota bacterium]MDP4287972.1 hypothetical protein [Bacteroidota bacterium]